MTRTSLSLAVSLPLSFHSILSLLLVLLSNLPLLLPPPPSPSLLLFQLAAPLFSLLLRYTHSLTVVSSPFLLRAACPAYLCPSSGAHRSSVACIAIKYVYTCACTCVYVCVYAHRTARTRALFVAGPAENTDLSPSASSPSAPIPLFWGFYTLSRAATTKPRASTMSDLLSLSRVAKMRVSRIPKIEKSKKAKRREKEFRLLFSRTVGLL